MLADIPGLIEGASEGKGLGDAFLRHVERTAVLLHLIDAYTDDVAKAYEIIRNELASYNEVLLSRPEIIALTKIEGLDADIVQMQIDALKEVAPETPIFAISSPAHTGLKEVLRALRKEVVQAREAEVIEEVSEGLPVISLGTEQEAMSWHIKKIKEDEQDVFFVTGTKIEKFARRTRFESHEGVARLRDIMKKMGISHALNRAGAEGDSVIRIGINTFTLHEQRDD